MSLSFKFLFGFENGCRTESSSVVVARENIYGNLSNLVKFVGISFISSVEFSHLKLLVVSRAEGIQNDAQWSKFLKTIKNGVS